MNITLDVARRPLGMINRRLDRRHMYSRFCPVNSLRIDDFPETITCCTFSPCQKYILVGTHDSDIIIFNAHTGRQVVSYASEHLFLNHIEFNQKGNLLLISTKYLRPMTMLLGVGAFFEMEVKFTVDSHYMEFSKLQDKVVATQRAIATIYDIATHKPISTFVPSTPNWCIKNCATFNINDKLILSDGILWDVNSGREIYNFGKRDVELNGIFHPNGTEIILRGEIWDLRTFNLLKTVPDLDQMKIMFSPVNHIIYAYWWNLYLTGNSQYTTSFKTLDALDYSTIAVYDVNRRIENLACNKYGTQIAVVENEGEFSRCKKSCVRLYDVGRSRDAECKVEGDYDEDDSSSSVETSSFTFDDRTLDLDLDSESEDLTDSEENDS